jgi:hypothetical protein
VTAAGAATVGCRFCAAESRLDETNIVRCAQIAAFIAAHHHPEGFAVSLTVAVTAESESSQDTVADPFVLDEPSGSTAR